MSYSSQDFLLAALGSFDSGTTQPRLISPNTLTLLDSVDPLLLPQSFASIPEGRVTQQIQQPIDSIMHFGKLLQKYILNKNSGLMDELYNKYRLTSFTTQYPELFNFEFTIVKSIQTENKYTVRSFVHGDSEQQTPRLHIERLGLTFLLIITKHINANKIKADTRFNFIDTQFTYTYDGQKRYFIKECNKPRVVEEGSNPAIEEPKSKSSKQRSDLIPNDLVTSIRNINRRAKLSDLNYKYHVENCSDFESRTGQKKGDNYLWTRISDIAYGSERYDPSSLALLKESLSQCEHQGWQYSSNEYTYFIESGKLQRIKKQKVWNQFVETLKQPKQLKQL